MRTAINRAYYAAFINARNYLRDQEGLSIPTTGNAHSYVSQHFELSVDRVQRTLGENLVRLRIYRRQADYVDKFPRLSVITQTALKLSEETILILNSL